MDIDTRFIEELSLNAHPSLNTVYYDGWYLRFAEGYTSRANSINILNPSSIAMPKKIAYCEKIYAKECLPTIFKITPISLDIDVILAQHNYSVVTPTNLMTMDICSTYSNEPQSIVTNGINELWQNAYFYLSETKDTAITTCKKIQRNMVHQSLCATISQNDEVVACGLGVIERDYLGLYDIVVSKEHRRKGYGQDICISLISAAVKYGVQTAYLQVVADNAKAIALYKKIGFMDQYEYWYRVKRSNPTESRTSLQ